MNDKGLKLLAKEISKEIYRSTENTLTVRLHKHRKGVPRKQEISVLRETELYKKALALALEKNRLYQDCINLNTEPDSLLMQEYMQNEEAYDAVADDCKKHIRAAAGRYIRQRELQYLDSLDARRLIDAARDGITDEFIRRLSEVLLETRLEYYTLESYWYRGRYWREDTKAVPVSADNYEDYFGYIRDLGEEELLSLAGFKSMTFAELIVNAVEAENEDLRSLTQTSIYDAWNDEISECADDILCGILDYFSEERLFDLVSSNRYIGEEFTQLKHLRAEVLDRVPERMPDLFPWTRRMKRHFVIHTGPTNSGKTYSSIERLKTAGKGIYLGPLRLLAFEQYEKLNESGYPCTLYTGEEHQIIPGARLQSSTIEMADEHTDYEAAVIDEAQMVSDPERGWAWTKAILGLRAKEMHVCIAPYAEKIIISLIKECGDTYEIVRHERQTPLIQDSSTFSLNRKSICKYDALIVFSRKNVHAVAAELKNMGISCSVIYGNLPYDVRQEEARRFRNGETDVVVATDAIGMGMNLPIKRIVFLEVSKFDGTRRRLLYPSEIQQIAGRAGRRGMYPEGLWNSLENTEIVSDSLSRKLPQIEEVFVGLPESLIGIDEKLSAIITEWRNVKAPEGYRISSLTHEYDLCLALEEKTSDKDLIYRLITIPFDEEDEELRALWDKAADLVIADIIPNLDNLGMAPPPAEITLDDAELLYRKYDLAYASFEKFGSSEDAETILEYKKELSGIIAETLQTSALSYRTCKHCGKKLRWNYPYGMCSDCFDRRFKGRHRR